MDAVRLDQLNRHLETRPPETIIEWAVDSFWPDIALSSSFQMQSLPLLHIVSRVAPQLPIIFLDTTYHFSETLAFRDYLVSQWGLTLRVVQAEPETEGSTRKYGKDMYRHDPDLCCYIHKVEPMQQMLKGLQGWISGIRRDQAPARANANIVEQTSLGVIRVHPMVCWTERDIWRYHHEHELPEHPLLAHGYLSVGCAPCTRPLRSGEEERTARWSGQPKTECGLHTVLRNVTPPVLPADKDAQL